MAFPLKQDINRGKGEPASVTEPLPVPSRTEAVTHSPFIHRQKAAVRQHQVSGVGKHTYIPAPGRHQETYHEFKASMDYEARSCLKEN